MFTEMVNLKHAPALVQQFVTILEGTESSHTASPLLLRRRLQPPEPASSPVRPVSRGGPGGPAVGTNPQHSTPTPETSARATAAAVGAFVPVAVLQVVRTVELLIVMTQGNSTEVTEFFLQGFGAQHKFQYVLFTVFLVIYVTTMVGNSGMILLVKTDSRLQTPMYFFLRHLAFVDICYSSAITPKIMQNFIAENKSISFKGYVMQSLVYATFVTTYCYLLVAMAVDHYMAIWFTFSVFFCKGNTINHFFCDVPPILALSCSNIDINIILLVVFVGFSLVFTVSVVICSYTYNLAAILKMSSTAGRTK
ncbi:olfactory receptor 5AK2 [Camelus ferus]|nr:olfactory receptor 5AK2 [Camelus ferus]